jgi:D-galactarolactone cycloisomerase
MTLRIVEIQGFHLACELPAVQGNSIGFVTHVEALLVALRTDSGLTGWGETWFSPYPAWAIISSRLAKHVLGREVGDRNRIWHAMAGERGYDRRGQTTMAASALDLALWDLAGQAEGVPIWRLLGGALRSEVSAYASGPYFRPGSDPYRYFPEEIETYLERGFKAVKLRLGTSPAADRAICMKARDLLGPELLLAVDLNEGFTASTATSIARAIFDADISWMEEPLLPDDLPGYRQLATGFPVPIAAGEAQVGCEAFHELIATGACAVIQPDLALCGGLTEGLRIAGLAQAAGCLVAPHVIGTFVNVHAALQLLAVLPQRAAKPFRQHPIFEYDQTPSPLLQLVGDLPVSREGTVPIPDGAGLGFKLDPAQLEPFVAETWTLRS